MADTTLGWRLVNPRCKELDGGKATISLGETAEEVAVLDGISREDSDAWGLRSQQLAAADARAASTLDFVPVETAQGARSTEDEVPRADTDAEALAKLKPGLRGRRHRDRRQRVAAVRRRLARSSSPASEAVERHGLTPRARVVAAASAGVPPHIMGLGPVPSTREGRSSARAGRSGTSTRSRSTRRSRRRSSRASAGLGLDAETVNADGGAIALGHPLGASGVRLVLGLAAAARGRASCRRGLATLCIGVGQGMAMIVERV